MADDYEIKGAISMKVTEIILLTIWITNVVCLLECFFGSSDLTKEL